MNAFDDAKACFRKNENNLGDEVMIGLGVDIIEIDRIAKAVEKNDKFLERLFTIEEQTYLKTKNMESVAGMFAAKEAVAKVLGSGISGFKWQDIEIGHHDTGQPFVRCHSGAKERMIALGISEIMISISHCKTYAVANAIGI